MDGTFTTPAYMLGGSVSKTLAVQHAFTCVGIREEQKTLYIVINRQP